MNKFGLKLLALLSGLFFSYPVLAGYGQPDKCPGIAMIQALGVDAAKEHAHQRFNVYRVNYYDTRFRWVFGIGLIQASNKEAALLIGNVLIGSIVEQPRPIMDLSANWTCTYPLVDPRYTAVAVLSNGAT